MLSLQYIKQWVSKNSTSYHQVKHTVLIGHSDRAREGSATSLEGLRQFNLLITDFLCIEFRNSGLGWHGLENMFIRDQSTFSLRIKDWIYNMDLLMSK